MSMLSPTSPISEVAMTIAAAAARNARGAPMSDYELIPTSTRGKKYPLGWVHFAPGINTKRRTMTESYLMQRMPRTNTIAQNQHYVEKVMNNKRTPEYNKNVIRQFVNDHLDKFMALSDRTEDPDLNEWARKKNAGARFGWISWFKAEFCNFR